VPMKPSYFIPFSFQRVRVRSVCTWG